jgi:formylglycine-generating enzyme required for sulfatase activity
VDGVEQRLRWIKPGTFLMGSPEHEAGRFANEARHRVTLTEGYWLADTPCTQSLWQAVMEDNPSRFRSPDRPVEQVSWDDCQSFFSELEKRLPGFGGRFPTEAEWEYACRAGTVTATWVGEQTILGANNAPRLDDIAWYGGNSGKGFELEEGHDSSGWPEKQYSHTLAGTRPVARRAANPWGLFDMLGNVWEWCEDRNGEYEEGPVTDPTGSPEGARRVYRGGSWHSDARYVRAAYRHLGTPSYRWYALGFRLARGQSALEPGGADRREGPRDAAEVRRSRTPGGKGKPQYR